MKDKLEPQQTARGELVSDYELLRLTCDTTPEKLAKRAAEAQLAHDKQRMVSIDWLDQSCPHSEPLALVTRRECDECMEELTRQRSK